MTVREYALRQLHQRIQSDPWAKTVMLAGGNALDGLAERILAIYNSEDFAAMPIERVRSYEKLLGIVSDESLSLAERRNAVMARWNICQKPSLAVIQAVCDSWQDGGIVAGYTPGTIVLKFIGEIGIPANADTLKAAIEASAPAHLIVDYQYRFYLIREIEGVMTLAEMEAKTLNKFAGGT